MNMTNPPSRSSPSAASQSAADALTWNVAALMAEPLGSLRELEVDSPPLDLGPDLHQSRGVRGRLRLMRTNRGLVVTGTLNTAIEQVCSRCLRDLDWSVILKIEEEALPTIDISSGAPVVTDEEDVLRINDHHELELEAEVRDGIQLAEPIAPLCRPDCPGLCFVCGQELGSGPHDHPEEIDPRLEALLGFSESDPE